MHCGNYGASSPAREVTMIAPAKTQSRGELLDRVRGEFLEMPGLRLTCEQGQRLWGLDHETCQQLLRGLVDTGFLSESRHGMFVRRVGMTAKAGAR
jgi:hypothetical protein